MKKKKIVITREIPPIAFTILQNKGFHVEVYKSNVPPTNVQLEKMFDQASGAICLLNDKITKEVMTAGLPDLKIIANYAAGYDNINIKFAKENNVSVTNTPGVLTDATAELAISLIFSCARYIPQSDKFVREDNFIGWQPMLYLGKSITNATLGILGAGKIGQAVVEKMTGFNMKVLYYNRSPKPEFEKMFKAKYSSLEEVLTKSDIISIHLPSNSDTHHLITKKELELMKNDTILVNTGRGNVIKEDDLTWALQNNIIGAAGLDVFENEPEISKTLRSLNNVVLTPHTGSATLQARIKMAELAANSIVNYFENKKIDNLVV